MYLIYGNDTYTLTYALRRLRERWPAHINLEIPSVPPPWAEHVIYTNWERWSKNYWKNWSQENGTFVSFDNLRATHPVFGVTAKTYHYQIPRTQAEWIIWINKWLRRYNLQASATHILETVGKDVWRLGTYLEMLQLSEEEFISEPSYNAYKLWQEAQIPPTDWRPQNPKQLQAELIRMITGNFNRDPISYAQALEFLERKWWNDFMFIEPELGIIHSLIQMCSTTSNNSSDSRPQSSQR